MSVVIPMPSGAHHIENMRDADRMSSATFAASGDAARLFLTTFHHHHHGPWIRRAASRTGGLLRGLLFWPKVPLRATQMRTGNATACTVYGSAPDLLHYLSTLGDSALTLNKLKLDLATSSDFAIFDSMDDEAQDILKKTCASLNSLTLRLGNMITHSPRRHAFSKGLDKFHDIISTARNLQVLRIKFPADTEQIAIKRSWRLSADECGVPRLLTNAFEHCPLHTIDLAEGYWHPDTIRLFLRQSFKTLRLLRLDGVNTQCRHSWDPLFRRLAVEALLLEEVHIRVRQGYKTSMNYKSEMLRELHAQGRHKASAGLRKLMIYAFIQHEKDDPRMPGAHRETDMEVIENPSPTMVYHGVTYETRFSNYDWVGKYQGYDWTS